MFCLFGFILVVFAVCAKDSRDTVTLPKLIEKPEINEKIFEMVKINEDLNEITKYQMWDLEWESLPTVFVLSLWWPDTNKFNYFPIIPIDKNDIFLDIGTGNGTCCNPPQKHSI